MEINQIRGLLHKKIAILPGSRDREGGPVVVFPSQGEWKEHHYQEVVVVLGYLSQIPDDKARAQGFTVVIDMRNAWIRYLKTIMRACQHALYGLVHQVLIIKPEQFLEKQKINLDLMIEAYELKTVIVSLHKLSRHIDITQLPMQLGGTYPYNHEYWIQLREKYEEFIKDGSMVIRKMRGSSFDGSLSPNQTEHTASSADTAQIVENARIDHLRVQGKSLLTELQGEDSSEGATGIQSYNPDHRIAAQRIEIILKQIQDRQSTADTSSKEKEKEERSQKQQAHLALYDQFSTAIGNLIDWLLGPGEKWLLTLHEIGESKDEAEQLKREHQQLQIKSQEVMGQVEELREMAEKLADASHPRVPDIRRKRDNLDIISRAFSARVKRQREIVDTSLQFHSKLDQLSEKLDAMIERVCSDTSTSHDLESVQLTVADMDGKIESIDKHFKEIWSEGNQFIDQLSVIENNSRGHEVTRDYSAGVVHIRQCLGDLKGRKQRCQDLSDVKRLKLQQLQQLFTCEKDGEQAIKWIKELTATLVKQAKLGASAEEAVQLRTDQQKLEETARSTYDYGKQLMQVSGVLRRSLRLDLRGQMEISGRMEKAWAAFCKTLTEAAARLTISSAFHATVQQVEKRLSKLVVEVEDFPGDGRREKMSSGGSFGDDEEESEEEAVIFDRLSRERKDIGGEVRELRSMADALINRIHQPLSLSTLSLQPDSGIDSSFNTLPSASTTPECVREIEDKIKSIERKQAGLQKVFAEKSNLSSPKHSPKTA